MMHLKEIEMLINSKEKLIALLKSCCFIKLSEDLLSAKYDIPENFVIYCFTNIPSVVDKSLLITYLDLSEINYIHFYKKNNEWRLALFDENAMNHIENISKDFIINDIKINHKILNKTNLMSFIYKQLQHSNYLKEESNLKVKVNETSENRQSYQNIWRKRSGDAHLNEFAE